MNQNERVDVFIVTYNRLNFLKQALDSILNQTYCDFKLFVLDNCSDDGTEQYIKMINDDRVNYIRHNQNIGGLGNISYAFEHCESEYFVIFHDDDILHPNLLEEEIAYLDRHDKCAAVSCLCNNIDEKGNYIKCVDEDSKSERIFMGNQFFTEYINKQRHLTFPATLYRTSFIKKNKINISAKPGPCADVVLYMDIEKYGGTIAEIPKTLIDYRIYKNQDSSSHLEEMLIKLIYFLVNDEYYGELLENDSLGRILYFKWYYRRLLARQTSKCIPYKDAVIYMNRMYEELKEPIENIHFYRILLKIADVFSSPANLVYRVVKKVKGNR